MNIELEDIEVLKIAQLPSARLPKDLITALEKEVAFKDAKDIDDKMYQVDSLKKVADDEFVDDLVKQFAIELYKKIITFDYLMLTEI